MASSKTANTYNRQNWEDSSFPILCETCLGPSPFLRMQKEKYGKECKICARPFTVFRWSPGPKARFKKTEICQTCAKVKNVCQTCIFDLEYGLPVEVRDKALRLNQQLPRSEVNREYFHQQVENQLNTSGDVTAPYGGHDLIGKSLAGTSTASHVSGSGGTDMLLKLARTTPYYRRNRPHICSFWVKGECRRGEECPYRHEKPTDPDDPLSDQNLRDRYYGNDDPVASKLLSKYRSMPKLTPPEDRTITTLYIGGIPEELTEKDLRDHFYQFGELRSVSVHHKQHCAFLQFTTRESAEKATDRSYDRLILRGHRLTVNWGKSPAALAAAASGITLSGSGEIEALPPVPGLPLPLVPPPTSLLPPTVTLSHGQMLSGFFSTSAPPPPALITLPDTSFNRPLVDVQLAPPVPESEDGFMMRGPPPPPTLPPGTINAAAMTHLPPPPPPPPPALLSSVISSNNSDDEPNISPIQDSGIASQTENKDILTAVALGGIAKDLPSLGVHYPSQNPQRMGSVPQVQKHV